MAIVDGLQYVIPSLRHLFLCSVMAFSAPTMFELVVLALWTCLVDQPFQNKHFMPIFSLAVKCSKELLLPPRSRLPLVFLMSSMLPH